MAKDGERKVVRPTVLSDDTDQQADPIDAEQQYAGIDFRPVWPELHRGDAGVERGTTE